MERKRKVNTGSLYTSNKDEDPLDLVSELYMHPSEGKVASIYVTVPCRNRRLFCRVFRSHRCV